MRRAGILTVCAAMCTIVASAGTAHAQTPKLGTITFPTSGAPAAQAAFLEGVKDLHSFQFDEAAEVFRKAEAADPSFALAYWGEAMSYNHPLWAQVDVPAAKQALEKLAPTAEARVAKAKTPKEKALMEAVNALFYTAGDKPARDNAYSNAMAKMYAQWPDDHEVDILYALSLLGTVRPGDTGFRRQALAASLAMKVYRDNPDHPGAAHFIIHSFDDPDHAILALPAARKYAQIAPTAAHALHMPSHIFVQLGMWDDVRTSNIAAYKAAFDLNQRMHLPEGREDFHTLSWLIYADLMLGKTDEARANLAKAQEAADRNKDNQAIRDGYRGMRARYILETQQWEKIPLDEQAAHAEHGGMAGMPGMGNMGATGAASWTFIAGYSAAKLGDLATAEKADAQLKAMADRTRGANAYAAKPLDVMQREIAALVAQSKGQKEDALRLAKEAGEIEASMNAPSGPPEPIKPGLEFYGDMLRESARPAEAAAAYEQQLLRTPNRTPSVKARTALGSAAATTSMASR